MARITEYIPEDQRDLDLDIMVYRGLVIPNGPLYQATQATKDTSDNVYNVYEVFLKDLIESLDED